MLIEFKVKNFRSFREEATLSMVASADKSHPENLIATPEFGGHSLLSSAVVYGANAAGKSNLISAASFMSQYVQDSMNRKLDEAIKVTPFLLTEAPNSSPSEFEITFIDEAGVRYQYGFHVTAERVVREWLVAYPKGLPQTWFEREHPGAEPAWYFGRNLKGKNAQVAELTRPDVLFLSNAAKFNHLQLSPVLGWFKSSLRVINAKGAEAGMSLLTAAKAKNDRDAYPGIRTLLRIADLGISDFDVQERKYTTKEIPQEMSAESHAQLENRKTLDVFMRHPVATGGEISLPIREESDGTQRFFALSGPLYDVLEKGRTLLVDELDASLHPLLVRYIVQLFHNPQVNPRGAQLIFNTQDVTLMDTSLFRRDQIWFVEKDRLGCSHLYPLLDYSPRKDESLMKGYLLGRYGAIPFLSEPNWGEAQHAEA